MDNTLAKLIRSARGPVLLMTLGALLAVHQFKGVSFEQTFPVLIIVFGMMWLLERMVPHQRAANAVVNVGPAQMPPLTAAAGPLRDPLAFDPLHDVHQKIYGDVPPRRASAPMADPNRDIPTAEHPIRQQPPLNRENKL